MVLRTVTCFTAVRTKPAIFGTKIGGFCEPYKFLLTGARLEKKRFSCTQSLEFCMERCDSQGLFWRGPLDSPPTPLPSATDIAVLNIELQAQALSYCTLEVVLCPGTKS